MPMGIKDRVPSESDVVTTATQGYRVALMRLDVDHELPIALDAL